MNVSKIVEYYFNFSNDDDDAELKTCNKFGITQESLDYILMSNLVDAHLK